MPPRINYPPLSVWEEASSAARSSLYMGKFYAWESIEVSSGSDSGNATLPDGGNAAESSFPETSLSYDAAICHPLAHRTRCWAPPCPGIQQTRLETLDGVMCLRDEMSTETTRRGSSH